ncbi:class F sortase [Blastococcus haudaquaticus]|uniref:Sortase family protein n=1 Tax=Blastococcus haudaquaticus TaxID=1938745 RepID=A0A286H3C0_9ACTN|nr:class F sortase [Blastococcus haudaquaticus]SOE02293.1 hypothetical protein SAMN06272739_3493 [Blastococcus haudaquaticus]
MRLTRRAAALTGAAALGLSGLLVLGIGLSAGGAAAPRPPAPAASPSVPRTTAAPAPEAAPEPEPTPTPTARYTPSSATRLVIPSVDLDLPLLSLTPRRGVIDPPLLTAGYWIEPYGAPVASAGEATNTLYVAAHSAGSGDDGFDPLLTADHEGAAIAAGDTVEVRTPGGEVTYTVERVERYGKNALADAAEVWVAVPGRLVLITCFQRSDGRNATENLVVFARS